MGMRVAQALLTTDGALLFCHGAISLLLVPSSPGQPYFFSGRMIHGVLPATLGLGSFVCAVWLGICRPKVVRANSSELGAMSQNHFRDEMVQWSALCKTRGEPNS
jgi:hypothetical protein